MGRAKGGLGSYVQFGSFNSRSPVRDVGAFAV